MAGSRGTEEMGIFCSHHVLRRIMLSVRRDGLVGYDAALTQLRSGVRFPLFVFVFVPRASFLLLRDIITSSEKQ